MKFDLKAVLSRTVRTVVAVTAAIADPTPPTEVPDLSWLPDIDGSKVVYETIRIKNRNFASLLGDFYTQLIEAGIPKDAAMVYVGMRFEAMVGREELDNEPSGIEWADADWDTDSD